MKKVLIFVIIAVVLLGVLFVVFKPKSSTTQMVSQPKTDTAILVIKNRKLVSGPTTIHANENDTVVIKITVDEDEELHLHGYDKMVELQKDTEATLSFKADMTGRFPYELENHKVELGNLEVLPK